MLEIGTVRVSGSEESNADPRTGVPGNRTVMPLLGHLDVELKLRWDAESGGYLNACTFIGHVDEMTTDDRGAVIEDNLGTPERVVAGRVPLLVDFQRRLPFAKEAYGAASRKAATCV